VVDYRDDNFPGRTGWKEIVAPQASATGAGFLSTDPTDALMTYPAESLSTPPQQVEAHIQFSAAASSTKAAASTSGFGGCRQQASVQVSACNPAISSTPRDAFTQAISIRPLTPGVMLFGLRIALVSARSARSSSDGKAVVAAVFRWTSRPCQARGSPRVDRHAHAYRRRLLSESQIACVAVRVA